MQAETVALIGIGSVLGLQSLVTAIDCLRCYRATKVLQRHAWRLKSLRHIGLIDESGLPPLTLVMVLRNQASDAVALVRQLMALKYPKIEYLVVNDGSDDRTLFKLQEELGLHPVPRFPVAELSSRPVRGVYQSEDNPRLWVIDKEHGGLADALNAGLNFCQTPLAAVISSRLQAVPDALIQATRPFLEQTHTWAVCGRIRPSAGGKARALATSRWGRLQTLLFQREDLLESLLASQAGRFARLAPDLSVFRRASLIEAGGFAPRSADMMADLAQRLYQLAAVEGDQMQLVFVPDTLGWIAAVDSKPGLQAQINQEQARARLLYQSGRKLPGHGRLLLRHRLQPMLHLLSWLCLPFLLALVLLRPSLWPNMWVWLWVWLMVAATPSTLWQLILMLGERTDQRFDSDALKSLQRQAWILPLTRLPALSLDQLKSWRLPQFAAPEPAKTSTITSPLKSVAK
ncbi:MAG: hypothetical protein CVV27_03375 [Candidatus Melainabacteria bacterium HGW-Melainabacteria-1]|nr:MAG: hypothetical protein CVV27_03375 [Candidatus Melainabacteria bacterium HGW-Melainabacteria-1]